MDTNTRDYATSVVRTVTPIAAGWLLSSAIGPMLDPDLTREAIAAVLAAVYYGVVRFIEVKLGQEWAGWLLGLAAAPAYRLDTQAMADDE